jgi:O-antigen/teichoic acid export membrane protein
VLRHLSRLSKQSLIYGLGTMTFPVVNFFLTPVYARYLDPSDYGYLSVVQLTQLIAILIAALSLTTALLRFYGNYDDKKDRAEVVGTTVIFLAITSIVATVALMAVSGVFSQLFFHASDYTYLFLLAFVAIPFDIAINVAMALFRAKEEPRQFLIFTVAQFAINAGLKLLFLIVLHRGLRGILEAELICMVIFGAVLVAVIVKNNELRFSSAKLKTMLSFALPLVPTTVAGWVLVGSDRYILNFLSTSEQVGLYSIGYSFGKVADTLVSAPLGLAWVPFMLGVAKEENAKRVFSSLLTYFLLFAMFVVLGLSVLSEDVLRIIFKPEYYDAHKVIPLIALSYLLYGAFNIMQTGIYLQNQTKYLAIIVGAVAILNAVLNLLLDGPYGMMGAAVATAVSFMFLPISVHFVTRRFYPISYEFGRIAKVFLAAIPVYAASLFVHDAADGFIHDNPALREFVVLVFKAVILLAYPVLLYVLRFYKPEELNTVRRLLGNAYAYVGGRLAQCGPKNWKRKP